MGFGCFSCLLNELEEEHIWVPPGARQSPASAFSTSSQAVLLHFQLPWIFHWCITHLHDFKEVFWIKHAQKASSSFLVNLYITMCSTYFMHATLISPGRSLAVWGTGIRPFVLAELMGFLQATYTLLHLRPPTHMTGWPTPLLSCCLPLLLSLGCLLSWCQNNKL